VSYLTKICDYKQGELESQQRRRPLSDLRAMAHDVESARDFYGAVTADGLAVAIIAEIKKASPSRGVIVADFDPVRIASVYEENAVAALSILTDEYFFQGQLQFVQDVKAHVALPILRKDFTLHEYHIYEARAAAADAILLIARILEPDQLSDYRALANDLGMTALIEVHDQEDLDKVFEGREVAGFTRSLLGINSRNLETFVTDLSVAETLAEQAPDVIPLVAESGIQEREDIERLKKAAIQIFLIGESLLVADDPGEKLRNLLS